jgi:SAM-dependent methyltransferase
MGPTAREQRWPAQLGAMFQHAGVAAAYRHRAPYPAEVFDVLAGLIVDEPRHVLDLGAGEGALARPLAALAPRVGRVDAVDISAAMAEAGRRRPGGTRPNLRWIVGAAESAPLDGPYALATAGASLHWMPWEATLGRLGQIITPRAVLVIVDHGCDDIPWDDALREVIVAHSRNPGYSAAFSMEAELERVGLLEIRGRHRTVPVTFRQRADDYLEQLHSASSLARELMTAAEAVAFGQEVREVVRPFVRDGMLEMTVTASLVWGRPR